MVTDAQFANLFTNAERTVALHHRGVDAILEFCVKNSMIAPTIDVHTETQGWNVQACGYYRRMRIHVNARLCAAPVPRGPRQWSYPGYIVDRTIYGVLMHELGHHVDLMMGEKEGLQLGKYCSEWSYKLRSRVNEEPITTYAPDSAEWFAEIFRLFITNPDLLKLIRPRVHSALSESFTPVEHRCWEEVLWEAPEKVQKAAMAKIRTANKPKQKRKSS